MTHYAWIIDYCEKNKPQLALDIGTNDGHSFNCFTDAKEVLGFETNPTMEPYIKIPVNGKLYMKNLLEDATMVDWKKVDFIFLDVDPHDGIQEPLFVQLFEDRLPRGKNITVLFDDIHINKGMSEWWYNLQQQNRWTTSELTLSDRAFGLGIYN